MNQSTTRLLIALALLVYGVYILSYVPVMLAGAPVPALLIGFVLQAVFALAAALAVWRRLSWAAGAVVLLGASVAGTWLYEGFILGFVAYLRALLVAVLALVLTVVVALYLTRQRDKRFSNS